MVRPVFPAGDKNIALHTEVSTRFGILPNFFCTAGAAPGLIDELWGFAKSAYLDLPFPSLFKERLFVYLSRFCPIRYCIVRHVGFLIGKGRPAGDASVTPETVDQIVWLLKRPAPDLVNMEAVYDRLNNQNAPNTIPASGTAQEGDLFDALAIMFVEPRRAEKARNAIKNAYGETSFELLTAYLAFIRTAHYWTETHPEIACEPDMLELMGEFKELSALLLDTREAERIQSGDILRKALNESQERYKMIFNSIGEAFLICEIILDSKGDAIDFLFWDLNPAFNKITGMEAALVRGKTAKEVFPDIQQKWFELGEKVAVGKATLEFDQYFESSARWFHFYATAIGETAGGQFIVVFDDITERKQLEQHRKDFLSIASHELKTPVASIKAYGQLLERAMSDTTDKENLPLVARMNAQITRLTNQIGDLLDTSKISEGQLQLNCQEFDLAGLIRTLLEEMQPLSTIHALKVECRGEIPLTGDKKKIAQVITNLVTNAVKYSPDGGEISITCLQREAEIEFSIKDSGIGIPLESQKEIFNRFYRVTDARSRSLPGMGLGLYICAGIVHRHGGSIGVTSDPGKGSVFYFILPNTPSLSDLSEFDR